MGPPKKWVFKNYTSFGKKQVKKGIKRRPYALGVWPFNDLKVWLISESQRDSDFPAWNGITFHDNKPFIQYIEYLQFEFQFKAVDW